MGWVTKRQLVNLLGALGVAAILAGLAYGLPAWDDALPAGRPVRTDQLLEARANPPAALPEFNSAAWLRPSRVVEVCHYGVHSRLPTAQCGYPVLALATVAEGATMGWAAGASMSSSVTAVG